MLDWHGNPAADRYVRKSPHDGDRALLRRSGCLAQGTAYGHLGRRSLQRILFTTRFAATNFWSMRAPWARRLARPAAWSDGSQPDSSWWETPHGRFWTVLSDGFLRFTLARSWKSSGRRLMASRRATSCSIAAPTSEISPRAKTVTSTVTALCSAATPAYHDRYSGCRAAPSARRLHQDGYRRAPKRRRCAASSPLFGNFTPGWRSLPSTSLMMCRRSPG